MIEIIPILVFGDYQSGDWISRYCRFRVDLPPGAHRLTGEVFNPPGADLWGNELILIVNRVVIGQVRPADPPDWSAFSLELPEFDEPQGIDIRLRTNLFRVPPPPDERLLGLILKDLCVQVDN